MSCSRVRILPGLFKNKCKARNSLRGSLNSFWFGEIKLRLSPSNVQPLKFTREGKSSSSLAFVVRVSKLRARIVNSRGLYGLVNNHRHQFQDLRYGQHRYRDRLKI